MSWNVDPLGSVPPVTVGFGVKSTALGLDTVSVVDAPLAWNELNTDPDESATCVRTLIDQHQCQQEQGMERGRGGGEEGTLHVPSQ